MLDIVCYMNTYFIGISPQLSQQQILAPKDGLAATKNSEKPLIHGEYNYN